VQHFFHPASFGSLLMASDSLAFFGVYCSTTCSLR